MDRDRLAPYIGALASLLLVAVVSTPYLVIDDQSQLLGEYYTAGPLGIVGVIFLATLGTVIFLSSVRGRADAELVAGIMLVVGVTIFALTSLWTFSIDSTVLFSFPAEVSWMEYHRWASLALSGIVATAAGVYATAVL